MFKKDNGEPFDYTRTQLLIAGIIIGRVARRVQLILPTQYGKSEIVAQAVLERVATKPEKWLLVAPEQKKAEIIMGYIIKHIFDDSYFQRQLIFDETMEKLKQHKSKTHLTFRRGGEIMVLSADARNRQRTKDALMGFGAPNVILDESALIPDDLYATIKRMVGGHEQSDEGTFLLEIGNPFTRGHFLRTWRSELYEKIWVDYHQALSEGRYSQRFIDEMREEAFFDILYECLFPEQGEVRSDGYRRLVVDATLDGARLETMPELQYRKREDGTIIMAKWDEEGHEHEYQVLDDDPVLGVDVAAGGDNETVFTLRFPKHNFSMVLERNRDDDLDNQADRVMDYRRKYHIGDYRIIIDDGGVGHGLGDILKNKHDILFKRMLAGESPHKEVTERGQELSQDQKSDRRRFANNRAMVNWKARKALKSAHKLVKDSGFDEGKEIYYKQTPSGKLQMEPKEKMKERGVESPDTWDSFCLTFTPTNDVVDEDDIYVD
jgi:hypothetical protein